MSPNRVLVPVSARSAITAPTTGPNLKPWPLHAEHIKTLPLSSTASIVNSWSGVCRTRESACLRRQQATTSYAEGTHHCIHAALNEHRPAGIDTRHVALDERRDVLAHDVVRRRQITHVRVRRRRAPQLLRQVQ